MEGKKHLCEMMYVCVCTCECVLSVRVIAQSLEASGGHAQFQLASLSEVHKHTQKSSNRTPADPLLERLSKFALSWECGETFEGLVRENLSSCDQHVFQIRNLTKTHADSPTHTQTCAYACSTYNAHIMHTGGNTHNTFATLLSNQHIESTV